MSTVGERVKVARAKSGLTLKEVTARANLSPSYLGNLEADGFEKPGLDKLNSIARALGVPVESLQGAIEKTAPAGQIQAPREGRSWCFNRDCPKAHVVTLGPAGGWTYSCPGMYSLKWSRGAWAYEARNFASFPLRTPDGRSVDYCSACGRLLLKQCTCGRSIDSEQMHCSGCGTYLPDDWMIADDIDLDLSESRRS